MSMIDEVTWLTFDLLYERWRKIMSLQMLTAHDGGRPFPKFVFVAVMCAAYVSILAALLYPVYMHLFVFD